MSIVNKAKEVDAPIAKKIPKKLIMHNDVRVDDYYWMKLSDEQKTSPTPDQQTKDVVDYLVTENYYRESVMSETIDLQASLYEEIVGRIKQNDESVPYYYNDYFYITKFKEGKEYPIRLRRKESLENNDEPLIDENERAEGHDYYASAGHNISPNNKLYAFGEDTVSRRQYKIRFKNLSTGEYLEDVIENTTGSVTWANDNETVFYTRKDHTLRSFQILKHKLGRPVSEDEVVFHEADDTFSAFVYKTKSQKYIVVGSYATVSREFRILEADNPDGEFRMFQPRERDHEYGIYHFEDKWYVITNKDNAKNFKVMTCPLDNTQKEHWEEFIPHNPEVLVESLDIFKDYLVISQRVEGMTQIYIKAWEGDGHYIDFGEEAFMTYTSTNKEYNTDLLRVGFTSMTTPNTIYDYHMKNKELVIKKQNEVVGDFDQNDYLSERLLIPARDGVDVPVSIVYKKGYKKNGKQPLLLYAYGSYGHSMDPYFSSVRLSLLDRGFAYAIAHIRGGEEMGRLWYEDGKKLKKKNTFNDFIDCGKYLIDQAYTSADNMYAMGGSAGGLLMGAVINMEPNLWKGVIAAVPFVDVVTTMLDDTIPLTTGEYDEWGNPNDLEYYNYIKSYSPYDQVERKDYPAMLVTTGYHDSQVQYWEPAKWVAKLRDFKTDDHPLLMYCNMETGHGGASGRFARFKETAMEYAFLLDLAGIKE